MTSALARSLPPSDGAAATREPHSDDVMLMAPVAGWVAPLSEVDDPVFSNRVLGDGLAIDPVSSTLRAPCDGTVTTLHRAHHALSLRAANGAEILMHIGLDTVALGGQGFTAHVTEGQTVAAGDPLISFDPDDIGRRVRSMIIPILLTNGERFQLIDAQTDREVADGQPLMRIVPLAAADTDKVPVAQGEAVRREVRSCDANGIHARPAGLLAQCAKQFSASLTLEANGRTANARSSVALMLLGVRLGDTITIIGIGADATEAVRQIAEMVERGLDEPGAPPVVQSPPAPADHAAAPAEIIQLPPLAADEEARISGVVAVPGRAIGRAFRMTEQHLEITEAGGGIAAETDALRQALARAKADLQEAMTAAGADGQQARILAAHAEFLDDPDLATAAQALIDQGKSAAFGWRTAIGHQVQSLRRLNNPLLAERAADLLDIERRVLLILAGEAAATPQLFDRSILVADDLLPSLLTSLDAAKIAGICLAGGGPTSHVAIMAASLGIPTLVAAGPEALRIPHEAPVILDADNGVAHVNPPGDEAERVGAMLIRRRQQADEARRLAHEDCCMADGTRIQVVANLGSLSDVPQALANGAEGCGLLRSEFLFLERTDAPSESEQLAQYQAIATALEGRPLIIRTLDAGGDKDLPYVQLPPGENPALGLRGVRVGLVRPDLLRTQLRAILQVKPAGQCSILLPMIATLADVRAVRAVLEEEKAKLGVDAHIPLGVMVEVPSAALLADRLGAEVDFFSVGTNDLTQYTLAMDRCNPHLAGQLDAFHPAVLRLIAKAAEGARVHGRWVGVCGGLASVPLAAPVLIGLGVTELSVIPSVIPQVKALIRRLTYLDCKWAAQQALDQDCADSVRRRLAERWSDA